MTQYPGPYPPYPPPPSGAQPQYGPPQYAPPQPPVAPPPRGPADAGPPMAAPQGPAGTPWAGTPPYGTAPPYAAQPSGGPPPSGPWAPGSTAAPPRRRRTGLIIGIVVGAVVVVAGLTVGAVLLFGSATLDSAKAEAAIAQGTQKQFGVAPTDLHCPSDVAVKAGSTFTCTAKLDGQPLTYTLKQTDDKGHVEWHSDSNISPVSKLQDVIAKQVGDQAGVTATASCQGGGRTVVVGATTSPIRCTVTNTSDPTDSVDVDASIDAQGQVTYQQVG